MVKLRGDAAELCPRADCPCGRDDAAENGEGLTRAWRCVVCAAITSCFEQKLALNRVAILERPHHSVLGDVHDVLGGLRNDGG